ncbi:hypothetical protein [Lactobacillus delbrueckii]|uniref:Uncharacterized protein n=1 Tax=Lactobacillus delbrueckii TaxID=1584 RepID=A0ABD4W1J7_9LACO|nr:hypothetical protein [Lactobacillus delbrueckii]MDA3777500.1 hypothetical protein [Lactobacillus delbrueckii]MDA3782355.1 hypothetical protein [Lactobacillus delbrueckii]MDA3794350.1 hypothetical protein [Lactobacillus delbrueckii]MDA3841567.1 hypothetical protein [Lactobacillus delbrueckii]
MAKDGQIAPYSYVTISFGISIIPFVDDDHVLLLKEYRYPVGSWQYNSPAAALMREKSPVRQPEESCWKKRAMRPAS